MKRWIKRGLLGMVLLGLLLWVGLGALFRSWIAEPPPLPDDTSILDATPETRDGRTWLGRSWVTQREGLPVICLKGSPFEMGYASGLLLTPQMHTLEDEFLAMIRGYVPETWKLNLLKSYVIYRNRNLSDFVPEAYRSQIHGIILGCPDTHPELGNYYNRMLNYHAAHDISYMMIDNPLVSSMGCTAFGAWGGATDGGHLVTGRNFDWEAAEVFGRDRVVILCEPDDCIPFISLAWASMAGVISGMNRAGVSVTINGAPSRLPGETAVPVAILARQVMEQAHNLDEALEIIRASRVFVSTLWLVGSRADGRFIVIEKTPEKTAVRVPDGEAIVCANHFLTDDLQADERNVAYRREATSVARETRLTELLEGLSGEMNAVGAAGVLRDRELTGGTFKGNGHRATLNALIATHATVMDLTDGIFWAASPPHQLGKFVAFDVNDFERELPELSIPADPFLVSGEYQSLSKAKAHLAEGRRELKADEASRALVEAEAAEALNPGFYENHVLRGRALMALGRGEDAALEFEAALAAQPAFEHERIEINRLLDQARLLP